MCDNVVRMTLSDEELAEQVERSQAARRLAARRWIHTTAQKRREELAKIQALRTPEQMGAAGRSDKPRCPCGQMTLKRAKARGHKCQAIESKHLKRKMKG